MIPASTRENQGILNLKQEKANLVAQHAQVTQELNNVQQEKDNIVAERDQAQEDLRLGQEKGRATALKLEQVQDELASLRLSAANEKKELEKHLKTERDAKSDLEKELETTKTDKDNLKGRLRTETTEKSNLSDQLEKAKSHTSELSDRLETASTAKSSLETQLIFEKTDKTTLKDQLESARTDKTNLQDQLNREKAEYEQGLREAGTRHDDLQTELNSLKSKQPATRQLLGQFVFAVAGLDWDDAVLDAMIERQESTIQGKLAILTADEVPRQMPRMMFEEDGPFLEPVVHAMNLWVAAQKGSLPFVDSQALFNYPFDLASAPGIYA